MRALRWHSRRTVLVEDVSSPVARDGQVLVRVERAGICGTDLEEYLHGPRVIPHEHPHPLSGKLPPITLGHEIVGVVADCPGGELERGIRVIPDVVVGCGGCWWCRRSEQGLCPELSILGLTDDGGLAEYVVASARTCLAVPDHVGPDVAAFAEPTSIALRALDKVPPVVGQTVAVVGLGTIGQLVAQVARGRGATVVGIESNSYRREVASGLGIGTATPADADDAIAERTEGRGADVTVECAGNEGAVNAAIRLTRPGGSIVLVGLGEDHVMTAVREVVLQEKRLVGSAAHIWDVDVKGAVDLLAAGAIDTAPLLTEVVPLSDTVERGFARLEVDPTALKILVAP